MEARKTLIAVLGGLFFIWSSVLFAGESPSSTSPETDRVPTLAEIAKANDAAWAKIQSVEMVFEQTLSLVNDGKKEQELVSTDLIWSQNGRRERLTGCFRTFVCGSDKQGRPQITIRIQYRDHFIDGDSEWRFIDDEPINRNREIPVCDRPRGLHASISPKTSLGLPDSPPLLKNIWHGEPSESPAMLSEIIASWKVSMKEWHQVKGRYGFDKMWLLHAEYPSKGKDDPKAGSFMDIYVNADKGYLIQEILHFRNNDATNAKTKERVGVYYEDEVTEFQDCGNGVFFPKTVQRRLLGSAEHLDDRDGYWIIFTATKLSVNSPLSDDAFDFRFPENMVVHQTMPDKSTKVIIWGADNKPAREFASESEYAQFAEQAERERVRKVVELKRNSKTPEDLVERCGYYFETKEFDKAIDTCSELIAVAPNSEHAALAYSGRGMVYLLNKRDFEKAIADFTATLAWQPPRDSHEEFDNGAVYFFRGMAYANIENHLDRALADLSKALQGDECSMTGEIGPHLLRGAIYLHQGELAKAFADADAAVKIDPQNADALSLRARIHEKRGNREKAAADREACAKISKTTTAREGLEVDLQNAVHCCLLRLVPELERR
jgi:tetratricopeptide (TPR) repeat protein